MMVKLNQKQNPGIKKYTKEYLEDDLKTLISDLEEKEKHLQMIVENIQKHNSHS